MKVYNRHLHEQREMKSHHLENEAWNCKMHYCSTTVKNICDKFSLNSSTVCTMHNSQRKTKNVYLKWEIHSLYKQPGLVKETLEALFWKWKKLLNGWISDKTQHIHMNVNQTLICSKTLPLFSVLKKMKGDTSKLLLQAENSLIDLKINMSDIPSKCKKC